MAETTVERIDCATLTLIDGVQLTIYNGDIRALLNCPDGYEFDLDSKHGILAILQQIPEGGGFKERANDD